MSGGGGGGKRKETQSAKKKRREGAGQRGKRKLVNYNTLISLMARDLNKNVY